MFAYRLAPLAFSLLRRTVQAVRGSYDFGGRAGLCSLLLLTSVIAGCSGEDAIVLSIRPPAGVALREYAVQVQERTSRMLVYQSGVQPFDAVTKGRDIAEEPLRIGLRLAKKGRFLIHVRAAKDKLAREGEVPNPRASEWFFATIVETSGTTAVEAGLLEVDPSFDKDFDHFPDAVTWTQSVPEAQTRYQATPEVLDCVDRDPAPGETPLPARLYASDINPLAKPRCGLTIDTTCEGMPSVCQDRDGDGVNESADCDDNDPQRFPGNPRPRNCCQCTDRKSCATNHSKRSDLDKCEPARCDNPFDFDCSGLNVRCFVDEDCDGYSPKDPVPSQRDCDDTNPDVHPGATKNCNDPSKDWACDGNPSGGCVPCDLDGDGYQRTDAASGCPTMGYGSKPLDCDDTDRGVFPGSTSTNGATQIFTDLKGNGSMGGGSLAAALRRLCWNTNPNGTPQDADCDGQARLGCPPAMSGATRCDVDGDGFPNATAGCNPGNAFTLDCDDNNYQRFPNAPEKCGDGVAQGCGMDTPCNAITDKDGDGYQAEYDCDDNDVNTHPWAAERCNGKDDDCDGLIDEQNPDASGNRLVETNTVAGMPVSSIKSCTESNVGECGKRVTATGGFTGRCVCSGIVPSKLPGNPPRTTCPGSTDDATIAPKCFGAQQPGNQTCVASSPKDEDCDGRTDAPDGNKLKEYGETCGVDTGECVAGTVGGCDRTKINPFSRMAPGGFKVVNGMGQPFDEERRFLTCDAASNPVPPAVEACDAKDNDCNNVIDDCSGPGIVTPSCCAGSMMCLDLSKDFTHCGNCNTACNTATANACTGGSCKCGAMAACAAPNGRCKNGTSCVQCIDDNDCNAVAGKPKCETNNTCVQCLNNNDCNGVAGKPVCSGGTCVECAIDNDCAMVAGKNHCLANSCVECTMTPQCTMAAKSRCSMSACTGCAANADCAHITGKNYCESGAQACVECLSNVNCTTAAKSRCNMNACEGCAANADCTQIAGKPVCEPTGKQCVECLANTDCTTAPKSRCDTATNLCQPCMASADCAQVAGKPVCDPGVACVQCLANTDCTNANASRCSAAKTCAACQNAGDCAHILGATMCNAGVCM